MSLDTDRKCYGSLHNGALLPLIQFSKNQKACKACMKNYNALRYAVKGPALRAQNSFWKKQNPEKTYEYRKKFYAKPENRIVKNLITRLSDWANVKTTKADLHIWLGCSIQEWFGHLKNKFKPGMGWVNYGQGKRMWEIDHVKPLSSFNKKQYNEIKKAMHFSNTQPLWSRENQSKGAKVLPAFSSLPVRSLAA